MTDWMLIRVVLADGLGVELDPPPGRVLLAHGQHTFADFADTIDTSLGRWDLSPEHEFEVEGRLLASDPEELSLLAPDGIAESSGDVTLAEVGLRLGSRFTYLFDPEQRWLHDCLVEEVGVDPFALADEEPEVPLPVFGWGDLPDQYGRLDEHDEPLSPVGADLDADDDLEVVLDLEDDDDGELEPEPEPIDQIEDAGWPPPAPGSWDVVAQAVARRTSTRPEAELRRAVATLRELEDNDDWPWDVLWAAAGLDDGELPDTDEELWLELAAGVVVPRDALPLEPEVEETWAALEPADWAGAVIGLVRAGPGAAVTPESLVELVASCPEIDAGELDGDDRDTVLAGFATVVALWRALGAVDEQGRLTALGHWGLPAALERAWA